MTGTIALLLVLSVFNGLHGLIGNLYGAFDPDIRIEPVRGKNFSVDSIPYQQLIKTEGIENISMVLTDQALLKYDKRTVPAMVMGVDSLFNKVNGIDSIMVEGKFSLNNSHANMGYLGFILADQLSVGLNFVTPLVIYVPRKNSGFSMLNAQHAFKQDVIIPAGTFAVKQVEYDSQYLIIGLDKARRLLEYDKSIVSHLYIKTEPNANVEQIINEIKNLLGDNLLVKNKEEQHATLFKMMKVEKLIAYLILSFILIIAAFNIVGTLSMLIYEKKESIFTLKSMGANKKTVTRVFLFEGWLISLIGVGSGLIIGIILIVVQQQFGIVKFQGDSSFITDAYPVINSFQDVLMVMITVPAINFLASWYSVRSIVRKYYNSVTE